MDSVILGGCHRADVQTLIRVIWCYAKEWVTVGSGRLMDVKAPAPPDHHCRHMAFRNIYFDDWDVASQSFYLCVSVRAVMDEGPFLRFTVVSNHLSLTPRRREEIGSEMLVCWSVPATGFERRNLQYAICWTHFKSEWIVGSELLGGSVAAPSLFSRGKTISDKGDCERGLSAWPHRHLLSVEWVLAQHVTSGCRLRSQLLCQAAQHE